MKSLSATKSLIEKFPRPPYICPLGDLSPADAAVLQESVTAAIFRAMVEDLAEKGYGRMSMEAVARRAGVGKAALYRRWPSKEAMLVQLMGELIRQHAPRVPDTGSLFGDIGAFLRLIVDQASHPMVIPIMMDMIAEIARNPPLASAVRTAASPRRGAADEILQRAIARGELPDDIDHELAIDLLISPLFFRLAVIDGRVDGPYLDRLAKAIAAAITAARH